MLDRSSILNFTDLKTEAVDVPEWGGTVFVRTLTGSERDAYELAVSEAQKTGRPVNIRAAIAVKACCDESGKRIFVDEDLDLLGGKSAAALDRVFEVAARLSGISSKDVKELEKN